MSNTRYVFGWSDYRGGLPPRTVTILPMSEWTTVLPEKYRRYKIAVGLDVVGEDMTKAEADAMFKLIKASNE